MTNQEAIEILESIKERVYGEVMALRMAEKALENQKTVIEELKKIREEISRMRDNFDLSCMNTFTLVIKNIDNHIAELRGENK